MQFRPTCQRLGEKSANQRLLIDPVRFAKADQQMSLCCKIPRQLPSCAPWWFAERSTEHEPSVQ